MRRLTRSAPWALATAAIVVNGVRMRSKVSQFAVLDDSGPLRLVGSSVEEDADYGLLIGLGVSVDETTVQAAVRYARANDLDVLDLIPGDLQLERLYELARLVDARTYRDDQMIAGRGAGHATLVRQGLLDRMGLSRRQLDPVEYVTTMMELKRYAPSSTDLIVAPGLKAVELDPEWYLPRTRTLYGALYGAAVGLPAAGAALAAAGPVLGRGAGAATLAAYLAQPFLATAGGPVKPRDVKLRTALGRSGRELAKTVAGLQAPVPEVVREKAHVETTEAEARRAQYTQLLERLPAFFEEPRSSCPWCGSDDLHKLLEVPDMMQLKPGRFRLDECGSCRHVFQNPRLSIEGLDFYYRDFYDGLGEEETEYVFSMSNTSYRGRAAMLQGVAKPKRWLDVGGGHGHFCLTAKEMWPETTFDGLDLSDSILEAERRGWIDRAYKGLFPDMAPELIGSYDVVSMHHYLEHTREPLEELDAARTTLQEGGHLLIEVPDPDSRLGRALGSMWGPWFQPQHQHFVSLDNLCQALEERDFSIVATERGPAHQPVDLAFTLGLLVNRYAPKADKPWHPPTTLARRAGRIATWTLFGPLLLAVGAVDKAIAPVLRRMDKATNTYRVLARKN